MQDKYTCKNKQQQLLDNHIKERYPVDKAPFVLVRRIPENKKSYKESDFIDHGPLQEIPWVLKGVSK